MRNNVQQLIKISFGILSTILLVIRIDTAAVQAEIHPQGNGCQNSLGSTQQNQPMRPSLTEKHTDQLFKVHSLGLDALLSKAFLQDQNYLQKIVNHQWGGLMTAFSQGDIEQALHFVIANQREAVRKDWTSLHGSLPSLRQAFEGPLHLTSMHEGQLTAQATMPQAHASFQCPFEVRFGLDLDGQWRLLYF